MSMPLEGWSMTIRSLGMESSLATTTFWMLPPDSMSTVCFSLSHFTVNSRISSLDFRVSCFSFTMPALEISGSESRLARRFSLIVASLATPNKSLSWGIYAVLAISRMFRMDIPDTSWRFIRIFPLWIGRRPVMHSSSSLCPFPSTPAMPRISPLLTVKLTSFTLSFPSPYPWYRCSTLNTTSRGRACFFSRSILTSRPTISREISDSVISFTSYTPMDCPFFMMVILSHICLTSRILWEMNMTVCPCSFNRISCRNSSSVSCGVSTAVGSSSISILAPRYRAFRISTLCFIPTGRSSTRVSGSMGSWYIRAIRLVSSTAFARLMKIPFFGSSLSIMFSDTVRDGTSMNS